MGYQKSNNNTSTTGSSTDTNQYDPDREYMQQVLADEGYGPQGVTGAYWNYNQPYQSPIYSDYGPTFDWQQNPSGPYSASGGYGYGAPNGGMGTAGVGYPGSPNGGATGGTQESGNVASRSGPGPYGNPDRSTWGPQYTTTPDTPLPGGAAYFGDGSGSPTMTAQRGVDPRLTTTGGGGGGAPGSPGSQGVYREPNQNPNPGPGGHGGPNGPGNNLENFPPGGLTYDNSPTFVNGDPTRPGAVIGPPITPANATHGEQFAGPYTQWNQGGASGNRQLAGNSLWNSFSDMVNNPDLPDSVKNDMITSANQSANSQYDSAVGSLNRYGTTTGNRAGNAAAVAQLAQDRAGTAADTQRNLGQFFQQYRNQRQMQGLQGVSGLYQGEGNELNAVNAMRVGLDNSPIGRNNSTSGSGNFVGSNFGFSIQ